MSTVKFGSDVKEIETSKNTFGKSPSLSVDNSAGNLSVIDSTDDAFSGTEPFVSLSGDGSNVTIKVSGLKKDGAVVATDAEVVSADSKAKVYWKDNKAFGADTLDALKSLLDSNDKVAVRLNADISTTKAQAIVIPAGKDVTIDLNGHSLTSTGADAIANKGTLTIKGAGKVSTSAKTSAAVVNFPDGVVNLNGGDYLSNSWYPIKNLGQMTIDGANVGTVDTNPSSLVDNGWVNSTDTVAGEKVVAQAGKASLHIVSGSFRSSSSSIIKNDDYGNLVIDGGTFDCTNGNDPKVGPSYVDVINWNEGVINGGTFNGGVILSNGGYGEDTADHGLLTVNGGEFGGIASNSYNVSAKENFGTLNINGGNFSSLVTSENTNNTYTIKITGGTFVNDVTAYLVDGATIKQDGDKFVVSK